MTDRELERLKLLSVPPPRPQARARAMAAAAAAFAGRAGQSPQADRRGPVTVEAREATRGVPPAQSDPSREAEATRAGARSFVAAPRDVAAPRSPRRSWMRRPEIGAMAAAIALVALGIPLAVDILRPVRGPDPAEMVSAPKSATAEAPATAAQAALSPAAPDARAEAAEPAPQAKAKSSAVAPDAAQRAERADPSTARRRSDAANQAEQRAPEAARLAPSVEPPSPAPLSPAPPSPVTPSLPPPSLAPPPGRSAPGVALLPPHRLGASDRAALGEPLTRPAAGGERYATAAAGSFRSVADEPVSTFSLDVDTSSYALVRRHLVAGRLPPRDAVRVEEMINYFPYDWPAPTAREAPFQPTVTVVPSPWNPATRLVHIAIKGYSLKSSERPRANLVFLVDVSGSMAPDDRLPLLKRALRLLVDELRPEDTVAIVTYASGSDVRLPPTRVADRAAIVAAIDSLVADGSTHGAAGIQDAYRIAQASFDKAAVNRVILATDGDWNVGVTDHLALKRLVEERRRTGIYLSVLGFGMGNLNDALMQTLAQNGNGVAAYIDTLAEARKVLVEEASSTLFPIARDVKVQLEFNPARVARYRPIGYETRMLRRQDFADDGVDAGDIGAGHSVTAIYEIVPVGGLQVAATQTPAPARATAPSAETTPHVPAEADAVLRLRYKLPDGEQSRLIEMHVGAMQAAPRFAAAPTDVRFSVAVAAFAQVLRREPELHGFTLDDVTTLAEAAADGPDPHGYRSELIALVRRARGLGP